VREVGADKTIDRNANLIAELGSGSFDVVIDLVAGPSWPAYMELLRAGGRYATAGAIGGPISEIDIRTLYLKDLTLFGCTFQEDIVFENLVSYVERGEVRPVVANTYPLAEITQAQEDFLSKRHTGKLVLIPPKQVL
jgi:NADPH:quinone reductase-like Zn-dependent oxidoreductase